ncbi:MAG: chemotaxis protein CheC [Lachnospiraceae bacterium]|nr:chemotaxis protein CheC [Lachnospiraceae bacterium]MBP3507203.1 chemotaxis protein CheC [Lachnospiraceae bacterium]
MEHMDNTQLDVLTEIGTIGAGNATTSLSVLLNSKLSMKIPKVSFMDFDDFVESIGGAENVIAGVMSNITGEIEGFVLFAMDIRDAHRLVNRLRGIELSKEEMFTDIDLSAVKEIGNILISSYLSSIETLTGISIRPSNPMMSIDMAGAILSFPAIVNSREHDEVLRIESQFEGEDLSIEGHIMMIADTESYMTIRTRLGI